MDKQIVVYKGADDVRLEVQTDGETVWLTQEQMCRLFGRTQPVIARHIANIFKEGELDRDSVYAKNAYTASDGKIYCNMHVKGGACACRRGEYRGKIDADAHFRD